MQSVLLRLAQRRRGTKAGRGAGNIGYRPNRVCVVTRSGWRLGLWVPSIGATPLFWEGHVKMKRLVPFMLVAMLLALASAAGADGSWADKVKVNGYAQLRYAGGDEPIVDDFAVRRAFANIIGTPNDRTMFVLSLAIFDPMPPGNQQDDILVYNLFADYKIDDVWSVRFGQVPTYFGLEAWQSSSDRLALERARILQGGGAADTCGFYFNGASDRGLWLKYTGKDSAPDAYFGICNGQFRSGDTAAADGKNISIDLKWDLDWGKFGLSWFDGDYDDGTGAVTDRSAWDAYVKWTGKTVDFQAEYADGKLLGRDRDGWYAQLAFVGSPDYMPFLKYEEYNSDSNLLGGSGSSYEAIHAGVALQLDAANELTLQISDTESEMYGYATSEQMSSSSSDTFEYALSWQTSF